MKKRIAAVCCAALLLTLTPALSLNAGAEGTQLDGYVASWGEPVGDTVYSEDFEKAAAGSGFVDDTELCTYWEASRGSGADGHDGIFRQTDGNTYLSMGPFTQLVSRARYSGAYLFEFDYMSGDNQFVGVFFRSSGETFNTPSGSKPYFEADSSPDGNDGLGSSGIYLTPRGKNLRVAVKTLDETTDSTLGNVFVTVDAGVDFSTGFHRISIADDGGAACVFVDGALVLKISYSEKAQLDYLSEHESYTHAVITDASGAELATVENARICAEYSALAFGVRINDMSIDNISVKEYKTQTENKKVVDSIIIKGDLPKTQLLVGEKFDVTDLYLEVTYTDKVREDIKLTEEMLSEFDNTTTGAKLITVMYENKSTSFTLYVVNEYQTGGETTDPLENFGTGAATTAPVTAGGKPLTVVVICVCGGVLLVAVICTAIILRRKGKKDEASI